MEIELKEMTFDDFEQIKDILQEEFDDFWNASVLKSELENENTEYIVAKENDKIVGFAGIFYAPDMAEIMNIVTKKSERKKGIGLKLLDKLIKMVERKNMKEISLEVNENNIAAINLYKKCGFLDVRIRKNYYNGVENAIIMQKKLD